MMSPKSRKSMKAFFKFIFEQEMSKLRPGVAVFLAQTLKTVGKSDQLKSLTAAECINLILRELSGRLVSRKQTLRSSIDGLIGNFALHSSVAFDGQMNHQQSIFNYKTFLRDHLFYLVNPVNPENCWFFALFISPDIKEDYLSTINDRWLELITYFDQKETLTLLTCFFGGLRRPVANLMLEDVIQKSKINTTQQFSNPKAKSSDGVNFEVESAISIIESSHAAYSHDTQDLQFSLQGVILQQFLENILYNMMKMDPGVPIKLTVDKESNVNFGISSYLNSFRIPFMSPANVSWSKGWTDLFPLSDAGCSVKMGQFDRTGNTDQIDGSFDIFSMTQNSPFKGVMECKDWNSQDHHAKELRGILEKCLKFPNSKLAFIFCQKIGGIKRSILGINTPKVSKLLSLAKSNRINILRFDRESSHESSFNLVPLRSGVTLFKEPALTAFVFSSSDVNGEISIGKFKKLFSKLSLKNKN